MLVQEEKLLRRKIEEKRKKGSRTSRDTYIMNNITRQIEDNIVQQQKRTITTNKLNKQKQHNLKLTNMNLHDIKHDKRKQRKQSNIKHHNLRIEQPEIKDMKQQSNNDNNTHEDTI